MRHAGRKHFGPTVMLPYVCSAVVLTLSGAAPGAWAQSTDYTAAAIQYLDHLKACTPHTFKYPHPFVPSFTGQDIIKGREGDKCHVTFIMPNNLKMECELSAETIRLMTSEAKYREARAGEFQGSSSDPESKRVGQECRLIRA